MTFEEALERKKEIGREYLTESGMKMKVMVIPANENDQKDYFQNYYIQGKTFDDTTAKVFSRNKQFAVFGILIHRTVLTYKELTYNDE